MGRKGQTMEPQDLSQFTATCPVCEGDRWLNRQLAPDRDVVLSCEFCILGKVTWYQRETYLLVHPKEDD